MTKITLKKFNKKERVYPGSYLLKGKAIGNGAMIDRYEVVTISRFDLSSEEPYTIWADLFMWDEFKNFAPKELVQLQ